MRQPPTPAGRGAIRTQLGRRRNGPRTRNPKDGPLQGIGEAPGVERRRQEALFDRLLGRFQDLFQQAGETTLAAVDRGLEAACDGLVSAGELTAEDGERLRELVRRDLLHRENPALTFRTGDITSAGTLSCAGCGWTIVAPRTTVLPPCPHCSETAYRKTD